MRHLCLLSDIKEKKNMRIVSHVGDEVIARRLSDMGLVQGMEFEILIPGVNNSPYLVVVNNTRLAIEEDLAKNLRVEAVCAHQHAHGRHAHRRENRCENRGKRKGLRWLFNERKAES
jgi:Fe2+ transport system protein FeoA